MPKAVFFSCAILLALFSCSNFGADGAQEAAGLPAQDAAQGGTQEGTGQAAGLFYKTISGGVELSGIYPDGFGGKKSAAKQDADGTDGADCVSKTIFPASDSVDTSALDYFVTASHTGLSDIAGTVTAGAGGVFTYSITLPFSSATDAWNVTVTGKNASGKILLSSGAVAVKASDAEKDVVLSYAQDPDGDTGSVDFEIPISASGVHSVSLAFGTDPVQTLNDLGEAIVFRKSGVAPGAYAIKILFYSETGAGGDVLYVISETVNVYSNLTTSVPYGHAEYITSGSGFKQITQGMIDAMQSVGESGIWLGGTGLTGIAASDDNSGTKFKPVASLWRATQIVNALAGNDDTKTYTINVQGNVRAGTDSEDAEIAEAAKVVIKGTNESSHWTINGYECTDTFTINSSSATFQHLTFDKLQCIQVAAGETVMNDCEVTNGKSAYNGIAGGITVSAGATLKSSAGLKITACENSADTESGVVGGGGGIWSAGTVDLTGAEISACKTTANLSCGGGIFAKAGTVSLKNSVVDGNSSISGGAGIYVVAASLSIDADTSVTGNSASGSSSTGGGLYVTSSCSEPITLAGTFCGNSANSGGAVYNASAADFTIGSGAVIGKSGEGNTAAIGGGVYHSGSVELKMTGGTIAYNTATTNGAGLCMMSGKTATISGGSISHNECTGSGTNGKGGGVYSNGTLYLTGGTISANSSLRGGGVYNDSSGKFFMYGSAVIGGSSSAEGNKAVGTNCFGGGVFNAGYCYFGYSAWTSNTEYEEEEWTGSIGANSSEGRGGGVYNAGNFKMISGTIGGATDACANTASDVGGGIGSAGTNGISLGGSASVPPASDGSNDIYLNSASSKITILSKLTASAPVGLLSIPASTTEASLETGISSVLSTSIVEMSSDDYYASLDKFGIKQIFQFQLSFSTSSSESSGVTYYISRIKKDTDYVPVTGTTTSSAVTNSNVFISGRSLTIPKMLACIHEVTQGEFQKYCYYSQSNKTPSDTYGAGDDYPAYFTSWYDAIVYCNLRSIDDGLAPVYSLGGEKDPRKWQYIVKDETTGKCSGPATNCSAAVKTAWNNIAFDTSANGWRIPTEAEWEYLARGGSLTGTQYDYSGSNSIGAVAWHTGNAGNATHAVMTAPTGSKDTSKPNALGIYDMTGNVWEVCWDWGGSAYGEEYVYPITPSTPATGVDTGIRRVVRGGSYNYGVAQSYVYYRGVNNEPQDRWENSGFRVVRNLP